MVITYDVTKDIRFKQGKAVGMEKGKQRGVKEGVKEGVKQGIKQGMKEAKESIIRKLLAIRDLSIHDVAQITDMPVSVVKGIKDSPLD